MSMDTAMPVPGRTAAVTAPAIEAQDLVKTYPKGVRALDGLSFEVPAGTIFGLLGPNGAGKSTTVKILTTLAQADSGSAVVAGLNVRTQASQVRHKIGVVGQRSGADPVATGRENVLLSGRIQGLRGRELARRPMSCSAGSGSLTRPAARYAPTPAACSAASTWRWAWFTGRPCCSSTSPPPAWTPSRALPCGRR